ncbi:hypothetical protein LCGC14_0394560 [marine sediment metagenome]|uniref:Uncharacterized protein n=1 Tax=marine sediment metagenome TaxID=412755 RepID=A0A0F9VKT6_9ZZZZ
MKKYTVYMLTPYLSTEGVEAHDEEEAIRLGAPRDGGVYDHNDGPVHYVAVEEEE